MKKSYYQEMVEQAKLRPLDPNLTTNQKQKIECLICHNFFEAAPKGKMTNFRKHGYPGCKECTSKQKYRDIRSNRFKEICKKFEVLDNVEIDDLNNMVMLRVRNRKCGHEFVSKYGNLLNRHVNCPVCNTEIKRKRSIQFNEKRHQKSLANKKGFSKYKQLVYKLTRENYRKHKKSINPKNLPRVLSGKNGYHLDHIISVRNSFDLGVPAEVCAHPKNLRMVEWKNNNKKWKRSSINLPDVYLPYVENQVDDFIKEIGPLMNRPEKYKDFGKFMLTLYSESTKFGIYYASLSMSREQIVGSKRYFLKLKKYFDSLGIRVLIIFEDEWLKNKELVAEKISHYLNCTNSEKIYARNCSVVMLDGHTKAKFLNDNHIQGDCISQINIGLIHNEKLVAVMTFSKPRVLMNKREKPEGTYELSRFATLRRTHVVGGASKLLKHFTQTFEWSSIFSYADRRWSEGNLYEVLGFKLTATNPMNYYYIVDGKRKHRWAYRKDALKEKFPLDYDSTLTEYQNMLAMGYDRVWDCGTLRYELQNKHGIE